MAGWTLDDIPWHRFDPNKVDAGLLRLVKAASLVEANGADYAQYLCNVFADDPAFQEAARRWGGEESSMASRLAAGPRSPSPASTTRRRAGASLQDSA